MKKCCFEIRANKKNDNLVNTSCRWFMSILDMVYIIYRSSLVRILLYSYLEELKDDLITLRVQFQ